MKYLWTVVPLTVACFLSLPVAGCAASFGARDAGTDPPEPLFPVLLNGKVGYINREGTLKIGFLFDRITGSGTIMERWIDTDTGRAPECRCDFRWAREFHEDVAVVFSEGHFGYINRQGEYISKPQWDIAHDFDGGVARVGRVGERERYGLIGLDGRVLIEPCYSDISRIYGDLMLVRSDQGEGVIDKQGRVIIEPGRYDSVEFLSDEDWIAVLSRGKWGFADRHGVEVIPPRFSSAGRFVSGVACVSFNHKYGAVDRTGRLVIDAIYEMLCPPFQAPFQNIMPARRDGKWGLLKTDGSVLVKPIYERMGSFSEDLIDVRLEGKWGFLDSKGTLRIAPRFTYVRPFRKGIALVYDGSLWGAIDKSGHFVVEPQFDEVGFWSEGMASVRIGPHRGYVNERFEVVIAPKFEWAAPFRNGLAWVTTADGCGIIDRRGEYTTPPILDESFIHQGGLVFREDMALVQRDGKYGFVDNHGRLVIEPQFDGATIFRNGLSAINEGGNFGPMPFRIDAPLKGGKWGYIDKTGKCIWKPTN